MFADGLTTVSYTHLDVYKRQTLGGVELATARQLNSLGRDVRQSSATAEAAAVSYTHLDTSNEKFLARELAKDLSGLVRVVGFYGQQVVRYLSLIHIYGTGLPGPPRGRPGRRTGRAAAL